MIVIIVLIVVVIMIVIVSVIYCGMLQPSGLGALPGRDGRPVRERYPLSKEDPKLGTGSTVRIV